MLDENLNTEALPDAEQDVPAADGSVSDSSAGVQVRELHEIVNELTGKTFPNPEAAAKSIVDTFGYTGEYGKLKPFIDKLKATKGGELAVLKLMEELTTEQPAQPAPAPAPAVPSPDVSALTQQIKEMQFYSDHPEYKDAKALIQRFGTDPEKVIEDPLFKETFDSLKARKEANDSRSVLHSNTSVPEVSSDYAADFETAKSSGDWVGFLKKHKGIELP